MKKTRQPAQLKAGNAEMGGVIERFAQELQSLIASDPRHQAILRASAELQEAARRIADAADTANGRGWVRLSEILELAAADPVVSASRGASEFLSVVRLLADDGITDESGDARFRDLHRAMSTSGAHRPRTSNHEAIRKRHAALVAEGWPKMKADVETARLFDCKVRLVREIRGKK